MDYLYQSEMLEKIKNIYRKYQLTKNGLPLYLHFYPVNRLDPITDQAKYLRNYLKQIQYDQDQDVIDYGCLVLINQREQPINQEGRNIKHLRESIRIVIVEDIYEELDCYISGIYCFRQIKKYPPINLHCFFIFPQRTKSEYIHVINTKNNLFIMEAHLPKIYRKHFVFYNQINGMFTIRY